MAEENFRWLDGLLYNSRVWRERDCSQTGSSTGGRVMRNSDGASTDHTCSLKPPWAALEAALAAAACTVLLDMTPDANSCWALSKLAPVVRYSAWIYSGCRDEKGEMRARFQKDCSWLYLFEHEQGHGGQRGEEDSNDDHNDAHWGAFIQAAQSRDPPTVDGNLRFSTVGWSKESKTNALPDRC